MNEFFTKAKKPVILKCGCCGKNFISENPSQITAARQGKQAFCSKTCNAEKKRLDYQAKRNAAKK